MLTHAAHSWARIIVSVIVIILCDSKLLCLSFKGVIALEYWRSIANAAKKEKKQNQSIIQLRRDVNELTRLVETQHAHIDRLTDALHSIKGFTFNLVPADLEEDRKRLRGLKS